MVRQRKNIVEYFAHYTTEGQIMYILQKKFGNDGYVFYYKLNELLGRTKNHFIKCDGELKMDYLSLNTCVDVKRAKSIINLLIEMGIIDEELWINEQIIWNQSFVSSLSVVYEKRAGDLPQKPQSGSVRVSPGQSGSGYPQSKVNDSKDKVNQTKVKIKETHQRKEEFEEKTSLIRNDNSNLSDDLTRLYPDIINDYPNVDFGLEIAKYELNCKKNDDPMDIDIFLKEIIGSNKKQLSALENNSV